MIGHGTKKPDVGWSEPFQVASPAVPATVIAKLEMPGGEACCRQLVGRMGVYVEGEWAHREERVIPLEPHSSRLFGSDTHGCLGRSQNLEFGMASKQTEAEKVLRGDDHV